MTAPMLSDAEREALLVAVHQPADSCVHNFVPLYDAVERIVADHTAAAVEACRRRYEDEGGLPMHVPMGVNAAGQGPEDDSEAHHWTCWCGDDSCAWVAALATDRAAAVARAMAEVRITNCARCGAVNAALGDPDDLPVCQRCAVQVGAEEALREAADAIRVVAARLNDLAVRERDRGHRLRDEGEQRLGDIAISHGITLHEQSMATYDAARVAEDAGRGQS